MPPCCRTTCGNYAYWVVRENRFHRRFLCNPHAAQIAATDVLDPLEVTWRQDDIHRFAHDVLGEEVA